MLAYLLVHILVIEEYVSEIYVNLSNTVCLFLLIFRCFIGLQVIKSFTAMIGIIIQIIFKMGPFFIIVLFFYLSTSVMFYMMDTNEDPLSVFRSMYIFTIFAGIDGESFDINLSVIPVLFGTIMIAIVLMNILIAYLSNEYSRLEERQVIESLKTKAELNFVIEVVISMLKRLFSKKFREAIRYHENQFNKIMKNFYLNESKINSEEEEFIPEVL